MEHTLSQTFKEVSEAYKKRGLLAAVWTFVCEIAPTISLFESDEKPDAPKDKPNEPGFF